MRAKTIYRFAGRERGHYLWIGDMPYGAHGKTAMVAFSCSVEWFWSAKQVRPGLYERTDTP